MQKRSWNKAKTFIPVSTHSNVNPNGSDKIQTKDNGTKWHKNGIKNSV